MDALVDIGANLTHDSFARDLRAVLQRAEAAGVGAIVATGTSLAESRTAADTAARHAPLVAGSTAGVHPHGAAQFDASYPDALAELHARPEVLAVGECGLDFNRDFSPRDAQRRAFAAQLELAVSSGLPVFMHERDAHEEFLETVRSPVGLNLGARSHEEIAVAVVGELISVRRLGQDAAQGWEGRHKPRQRRSEAIDLDASAERGEAS